jgi:hypothetical protein
MQRRDAETPREDQITDNIGAAVSLLINLNISAPRRLGVEKNLKNAPALS